MFLLKLKSLRQHYPDQVYKSDCTRRTIAFIGYNLSPDDIVISKHPISILFIEINLYQLISMFYAYGYAFHGKAQHHHLMTYHVKESSRAVFCGIHLI